MHTQQANHVNEHSAYQVHNYPYAFGKFCTIRYWVETRKAYGQRLMTQIKDPLTGNWFKAKTDGYFDVCIITTVHNPTDPTHGFVVPVQVNLRTLSVEHLNMFSTYYTFTPHQKFVVVEALAAVGIRALPHWRNDVELNYVLIETSENPKKFLGKRLTEENGIPIESQDAADKRVRKEKRESWAFTHVSRAQGPNANADDTAGMSPEQLAIYNMAMGRD